MRWRLLARQKQLTPDGSWYVWLVLAGRGWGKTRTGAEDQAHYAMTHPGARLAVVAPTYGDARDTCVEGESGLLQSIPAPLVAEWNRSLGELILVNRTRFKLFSADEPERLRGPQHHRAWCDELAAWKYPEAFDQLVFGLRLGTDPRVVVTTTPKPTNLIRELVGRSDVCVTRGHTFENADNLAPAALAQLKERYEGTTLGRQELYAEILDDMPGALWKRSMLDACRADNHPDLARVVVGVDPSGGSTDGHDEQGIVVAGRGVDAQGYVLADYSCRLSPDGWGRRAVQAYLDHAADRILVEKNFGGDMAISTIQTAAKVMGVTVPVFPVTASRGKALRAEPVAALYEQARMHHVGAFPELEDQLCVAIGTLVATSLGEKPIGAIRAGDLVLTRRGYRPVERVWMTGWREIVIVNTTVGGLRCTPDHPVYVDGKGFIQASEVQNGDIIPTCRSRHPVSPLSFRVSGITSTTMATSNRVGLEDAGSITETFGPVSMVPFRPVGTSITATTIRETTTSRIWSPSAPLSTRQSTAEVEHGQILSRSGVGNARHNGLCGNHDQSFVPAVVPSSPQPECELPFVPSHAVAGGIERTGAIEPVYNLSVEGEHEFFANGLLTHNCNWVPGSPDRSPDRLDALVWAATALMLQTVEVRAY